MPAIKLEQFGGRLPAWDDHLLPSGQASDANNAYLFSGSLQGWRKPKKLRDLTDTTARFVFRIPHLTQMQALAYLVFITLPQDGDTVTIGDYTYTWRNTLSTIADVKIGTDTDICATNLLAAITADNGTNANAGVLYGENTIANGDVYYIATGLDNNSGLSEASVGLANIGGTNYSNLLVGAPDFGAAFNEVVVAESTGDIRMTWLSDLLGFADTTTTYKGGANQSLDNSIDASSTWLEFADPETTVLKSQVVDDVYKRYYSASPSLPPKYNPYKRITHGQPWWLLGVPPPGCAPMVDIAGGGNDLILGDSVNGGGQVIGLSNYVYLVPITTPGATQITDVKFTLSSNQGDNSTVSFAAVIYDDLNGVPGGLLNTGAIITGITSGVEQESSFTNPTTLAADTAYWIGIMIDTAIKFGATNGGITNMAQFENTFTNGPPATAPTVAGGLATGQIGINMWGDFVTSDVIEARTYVYTWVSAYNEEGPPSPPTTVNGWSNGKWTVTLWQPPANDMGVLRYLTKINIYRTVVSQGGVATYFFVDSVEIGTTEYVDTITDDVVALNDQLPSTNWFPPPENLQGLIAMPNGVMAGFVENQVWFCEPYRPHAWPPGYVLTTEFPIVGLGLTNGALVACTSTVPYVITGNAPGSMASSKCSDANPCLSNGSILSGDIGVMYMSPNGLIQVQASGVAINTTDKWFTRENWIKLTPQKYTKAILVSSCYYCFGTVSPPDVSPQDTSVAQQGFTIELTEDSSSFTIWPQPGGHRKGFMPMTAPNSLDIVNLITDPWTGVPMIIQDGDVYYIDFADKLPEMITYRWRSKTYQYNNKKSFGAMKVFFTVPTNSPAQSSCRLEADTDDPVWNSLGANQYAIVRVYCDYDKTGELKLVCTREVRRSGELLRITSGYKAESWQFELEGRVVVSNWQIASSGKELANV